MLNIFKICSNCKQSLDRDNFYSNRKTSDNLDNNCMECRKKYTAKQYAKTKADPKLYFELKLRNSVNKKRLYQLNKQLV